MIGLIFGETEFPKYILKKIKKAKSDSEPIPENLSILENKPEALNLINIYVPNGNPVETEKYDYKKNWLKKFISNTCVVIVL